MYESLRINIMAYCLLSKFLDSCFYMLGIIVILLFVNCQGVGSDMFAPHILMGQMP